MTPPLVLLVVLGYGVLSGGVLGYLAGYLVGKSRPRAEPARAPAPPAAPEPPHAKWCHLEDGAWHCEDRCAWGKWKTELAMRAVPPPPGSRTLKIIKND